MSSPPANSAPGGSHARTAGATRAFNQSLQTYYTRQVADTAYSGVQVYQGDQYPEEYKGTILMGNIHDSSVHQDKLTPVGATSMLV